MAQANVSSSVLSIVASYTSGLDVFKRLREKRRTRKRTKASDRIDEDELRLSKSLRQGPEDIGREYQRSVHRVGGEFGVGDSIAQTSLAEILLRLNTGLVTIIASFLDRDKSSIQLDYQTLTELSENSRVETVGVLKQLFQRMVHARVYEPVHEREVGDKVFDKPKHDDGRRKPRPTVRKQTKVQGPSLARIVIQDSSRPSQLALVRGAAKKKQQRSVSSSSSPSVTDMSTPPTTPPTPDFPVTVQAKTKEPPIPQAKSRDQSRSKEPSRPSHGRSTTAPEVPRLRKKHSTANVDLPPKPPKPDQLRATRSTPKLHPLKPTYPTPQPPLPLDQSHFAEHKCVPLRPTAFEIDARRRRTTPTYYSTATASTKLGEIPMHKWAVPYDYDQASILNKEAERDGWPMNEVADGPEGRRKKFGLFRMFRRKSDQA